MGRPGRSGRASQKKNLHSETENFMMSGRVRDGEVLPVPFLAPAGSQILSSSSSQLCPLTTQPSRDRTRTVMVTVGQKHCPAQSRGSRNTCGINMCSMKGVPPAPRPPTSTPLQASTAQPSPHHSPKPASLRHLLCPVPFTSKCLSLYLPTCGTPPR